MNSLAEIAEFKVQQLAPTATIGVVGRTHTARPGKPPILLVREENGREVTAAGLSRLTIQAGRQGRATVQRKNPGGEKGMEPELMRTGAPWEDLREKKS